MREIYIWIIFFLVYQGHLSGMGEAQEMTSAKMRHFFCLPFDESFLNTRRWLLSLCPSQTCSFSKNYFCSMLLRAAFDNDTQNPCHGFSIKICSFSIKNIAKVQNVLFFFFKVAIRRDILPQNLMQTIQGMLVPIKKRECAGIRVFGDLFQALVVETQWLGFYLRGWQIINSQRRAWYFTLQVSALQMVSHLENKQLALRHSKVSKLTPLVSGFHFASLSKF